MAAMSSVFVLMPRQKLKTGLFSQVVTERGKWQTSWPWPDISFSYYLRSQNGFLLSGSDRTRQMADKLAMSGYLILMLSQISKLVFFVVR
jgi:hypothetical protein